MKNWTSIVSRNSLAIALAAMLSLSGGAPMNASAQDRLKTMPG
jgi:hypothetical protein